MPTYIHTYIHYISHVHESHANIKTSRQLKLSCTHVCACAYQDAYWLEYGHHWVMRYASASDVRGVLLGLLVLVSFFAYGIQHTRYTTAVRYLQKAAERNLGPKSGGNAAVRKG